mgnify:FL=1
MTNYDIDELQRRGKIPEKATMTESEWTEYNRDREKRSRGIVIQNDSSSIEIDLDKGDALKLALKAHDQNITLNQHIINVLKHQLENDDYEFEHENTYKQVLTEY